MIYERSRFGYSDYHEHEPRAEAKKKSIQRNPRDIDMSPKEELGFCAVDSN
jgi:hypothetical protein